MTGTQSGITVKAAAATGLAVTGFPSPTAAGTASNFTVTARDLYGNTAPTYTGTVNLTSSDPKAVLPATYAFVSGDNGTHTFSATLKTVGSQSLTATDSGSGFTSSQTGINVVPAATTLVVSGFPSPATAGVAANFTVTAQDTFGNLIPGYTGTVAFTSSDPGAVLPPSYKFVAGDNGVHTFSATLKTAGTQSITARDNASGIMATQSGIAVNAAATSQFLVAGFTTPVTAGTPGSFTVTAADAFGNLTTGYTGTVHFTSSDGQALLPGSYAFVAGDKGMHTFSATLETAGSQSITATDAANLTGKQAGIAVNAAAPAEFLVTGFPSPATAGVASNFTVTAADSFGNPSSSYLGTVHFTSSDTQAVLPGSYTFVAGDLGVHSFSAVL